MKRLLLLALSATQTDEGWQASLSTGDFRTAWSLATGLADPLRRARAEAEIRYEAGDPAGALSAAEGGLARAPEELELLFYAGGAALWLSEAKLASAYASRLERALGQASLPADAREAWNATARAHAEQAQELATKEAARDRAVSVARAVSVLGLSAALAALYLVSRQGRSSSPVS